MKKILNKGDKELFIHHVLKGVVDRLESCEPGESNYDFRRGCVSVAASVVQQVTNYHGSDVFLDDVFEVVNRVTRDREGWWVEVEAEGEGGKSVESVIPTLS